MFIAEKVANRESGKNYAIINTKCDGEQIANSIHKTDAEILCKLLNNYYRPELFGNTEQVKEECEQCKADYFEQCEPANEEYEEDPYKKFGDSFALEAMRILLHIHVSKNYPLTSIAINNISVLAYEMADHMISARNI